MNEAKIQALEASLAVGRAVSYIGKVATGREVYGMARLSLEEAANMVNNALFMIDNATTTGMGVLAEAEDSMHQMQADLERLEPDGMDLSESVSLAQTQMLALAGVGVNIGASVVASSAEVAAQLTAAHGAIGSLADVANGSQSTLRIAEGLTETWSRNL